VEGDEVSSADNKAAEVDMVDEVETALRDSEVVIDSKVVV
jgi:hypothetical protein